MPAAPPSKRDELAPFSLDQLVGGKRSRWHLEAERFGRVEAITSSNMVDCMTGSSAGLVPLRPGR